VESHPFDSAQGRLLRKRARKDGAPALEALPFPFVAKVRSFHSAEALRHPNLRENALIFRCECRTCRGPSTT
jgi:hypothetical protein